MPGMADINYGDIEVFVPRRVQASLAVGSLFHAKAPLAKMSSRDGAKVFVVIDEEQIDLLLGTWDTTASSY